MKDVKLHDIGEGMTEAEILRFFVNAGDEVKVDQPLVEVQTDKMTAELPSPAAGVVKEIKAETGDVVEVGEVLLVLEGADGAEGGRSGESPGEGAQPEAEERKPGKAADAAAATSKTTTMRIPKVERVLAAPYTRKIARDHHVDIEQVAGTGPAGRVTDEDVMAFVKQDEAETAGAGADAVETSETEVKEIPFRGRRKAIAKKMTQSMFTIPHVTHFEEADVTGLMAVKQSLKAADPDKNASAAAFFIKALQLALGEFPIFNAKLDEEKEVIRLEKTVNIGLATDTDEGLIVPVIHHVERLSVLEIHQQMKALIRKAKDNKLTSSDMTGGTFTISNVGPLGSIGATPIINYPEVGLMAFHKTKKRPVVDENDQIVIRQMMNVSMTFDHRVADGAKAVAFTNRFVQYIENPNLLLVELV
ncbi:MAG TPA: dihydrolipoamide acetyltransferase family protein [Bacillales bacterium]|nr:dihydrolipoamide acetyltransferase family protein [Bacillales bacterium]